MKRRRFLQTALAAGTLAPTAQSAAAPALRVVDTHTHFYDPGRPGGVPWPPKNSPLYRRVLPADWLAQAAPLDIRDTVVVEASPLEADNQWILDLAEREKSIVGFVGNLDPYVAGFGPSLTRLAANALFRGIRWRGDLVSLDKNPDIILTAAKQLAALGLSLDVNGPPSTLPRVARLAAEVPDLRIVINHVGSAGDPQNLKPEWKENTRQAAAHRNIFMKVSGMPEQLRLPQEEIPKDTDYYRPVLDHLWECFGPDRLIYGSNWPVSDRGLPYADMFQVVSRYFHAKGQEAAEKYFHHNSRAAYRWIDRS